MIDFEEMEKIGNAAVKRLRADKLLNGIPFMINLKELPSTECYLEYPDGHISLTTISSSKTDFEIIRNLSPLEAKNLRKRLNLPPIHA